MAWDLLDEDCSDISDWDDDDTDTAVSEVSPAGQFRLDTNLGAAGNAIAQISRDIGSFPNTFTIEIKLYHDTLGTRADSDYFVIRPEQGDERSYIYFATDGCYVRDNSGFYEVGTDLVKHGGSAEWQTWRFLITYTGTAGAGTCDVYLKDSTHNWEKVGTNMACSYQIAGTDGELRVAQSGYVTDNMVTHVDYFRIATGLVISRERNIVYDSILELSKTRDVVYDSVLELSKTRDIVCDLVLELSRERNILYDSVLELSRERNIVYDSILELSKTRDIVYDLVLELSRERNILYDSVLEVSKESNILYDLFELIERLEAPAGVWTKQNVPSNGAVKQIRPTGTWTRVSKPS